MIGGMEIVGDERAMTDFARGSCINAVLCAGVLSLSILWAACSRAESTDESCKRPPPSGPLADPVSQPKAFTAAVAGLDGKSGLRPVYLDEKAGRVLIVLRPPPNASSGDLGEFLYQVSLRTGLGSTFLGLDRSQPAGTQVIAFRRVGKKVFAELE